MESLQNDNLIEPTPPPVEMGRSDEADTERFSSEVFKFTPSSVNERKRTVTCIAADDSLVPRWDWRTEEEYDLQLDMSDKSANLKRMNNGAPLCADHASYSVRSVLGVVERAWIENKKLMAEVRFSARPAAEEVWQDVKSGILRHLSIGAWIHFKKDMTPEGSTRRRMVATSWEPFELSVVPVPAIAGATFMSAENPPANKSNIGPNAQEEKMEKPIETTGGETRVDPAVIQAAVDNAVAEAQAKLAARNAQIVELCGKFKIDAAPYTSDIKLTVEEVRAKILDQLAKASEETPAQRPQVSFGWDETTNLRAGAAAALLLRHNPEKYGKDAKQAELASQFRAMTMMEMAKLALSLKGEPVRGKSANEIAMAAITRSDMPNILIDVANKTLRDGYELAPQTFRPIARRSTATDFKNINRVLLSGAPALIKVNESGEFEQGKMFDSRETYAILTYGRLVNISRQTIINDDLNALTRVPQAFGQSAAQLESDLVWGVITNNGVMADGTTIFHSTRNNLGTPGAISVTTIDEAYTDMAMQTSLEGKVLNLQPTFLAVPTGRRMAASQFLNPTQLQVSSTANVIPGYMQNLQLISESRLQNDSPNAYYLFASPDAVDTVEYAYLEGSEGVYFETQMGFHVDGIQMKARLDFGAAAIDYRGMYKNAGQ